MYKERCPLYEFYADIIIDGEDLEIEEVVNEILNQLHSKKHST
ncbi:hypothetical protein [Cohnella yongneupensis]|uniref:Adenylate kinase n=1 Tax=Cohnella yongneupensis TaxID=425006 RepID=A0ABW0QW20_9BACL